MIQDLLGDLSRRKLVLASQSPRRQEILRQLGLTFDVRVSGFEENLNPATFPSPEDYVRENALQKARTVAGRNGPDARPDIVIGSDTVVVLDGVVLEKPNSEAEAFQMLSKLSGNQHRVVSAVVLLLKNNEDVSFTESTQVTFVTLPPELITAYIRTGEPMDKAGAYGIQSVGGSFVSKIDGCFYNVMGFPMHKFASHLRALVLDGVLT